jgi:hypothetical protein
MVKRTCRIVLSLAWGVAFVPVLLGQAAADERTVDPHLQQAILDSVTAALNGTYVFPDKATAMEAFVRKQFKDGKYKSITQLDAFTQALTEDLRSVCRDRHLAVRPQPAGAVGSPEPAPEEQKKEQLKEWQRENFGFRKLQLLPGNIGLLDLRFFADARTGGATAEAAMHFLAHADAVVFDLRLNGGGEPSMIQLITSYLFEEPVHLNSFYIRKSDSTRQFWTQSHVAGRRMKDTPVYILTSRLTFSGAEEFTYNLKNLKRATVIGETTGGGAHPVEFRSFKALGVAMSLPFGRAVNPITKTNWEGTGVAPDIGCPAEQALIRAQIEAATLLAGKARDSREKRRLEWIIQGLESELHPAVLDSQALKAYAGVYGPRTVTLENGALYYKREQRMKYPMVPVGKDMFMLKDLDFFRIQFKRDASGRINEFVGLYDDGTTDSNPKSGK